MVLREINQQIAETMAKRVNDFLRREGAVPGKHHLYYFPKKDSIDRNVHTIEQLVALIPDGRFNENDRITPDKAMEFPHMALRVQITA